MQYWILLEEQDMGLWSVDFVVLPPQTLYKVRVLVENLMRSD